MLSFFPENSDEKPTLVMTDEDDTDCAWCLEEAGLPMGNGSHNICPPHKNKVYAAYQERKAERAKRQRH